jgi:hypothetical protein
MRYIHKQVRPHITVKYPIALAHVMPAVLNTVNAWVWRYESGNGKAKFTSCYTRTMSITIKLETMTCAGLCTAINRRLAEIKVNPSLLTDCADLEAVLVHELRHVWQEYTRRNLAGTVKLLSELNPEDAVYYSRKEESDAMTIAWQHLVTRQSVFGNHIFKTLTCDHYKVLKGTNQ